MGPAIGGWLRCEGSNLDNLIQSQVDYHYPTPQWVFSDVKKRPGFKESGQRMASLLPRGASKSSRKRVFLLVQRNDFGHFKGLYPSRGLDTDFFPLLPTDQAPADGRGD